MASSGHAPIQKHLNDRTCHNHQRRHRLKIETFELKKMRVAKQLCVILRHENAYRGWAAAHMPLHIVHIVTQWEMVKLDSKWPVFRPFGTTWG